jgi:hypothetical protein
LILLFISEIITNYLQLSDYNKHHPKVFHHRMLWVHYILVKLVLGLAAWLLSCHQILPYVGSYFFSILINLKLFNYVILHAPQYRKTCNPILTYPSLIGLQITSMSGSCPFFQWVHVIGQDLKYLFHILICWIFL